ncbi:MAG: hypothetical protein ACOYVD_14560 [Bacillota bacterium]
MNGKQTWSVEKIDKGLVYFTNGFKDLVIPLGIIPGKLAPGDLVLIKFDEQGNVVSLKVVVKNITQR